MLGVGELRGGLNRVLIMGPEGRCRRLATTGTSGLRCFTPSLRRVG